MGFTNGLILLAMVGAALCVIVYWPRFDRHNPIGANAMGWMLVAMMALGLATLRVFADGASWFNPARTTTFALVNIVVYWRLLLLVRARRQDRESDQPPTQEISMSIPTAEAPAAGESLLASLIRTYVPMLVGLIGPALTQYLGLSDARIWSVSAFAVAAGYYLVVRLVETYVSPKVGWLLGYAKVPGYSAIGSARR